MRPGRSAKASPADAPSRSSWAGTAPDGGTCPAPLAMRPAALSPAAWQRYPPAISGWWASERWNGVRWTTVPTKLLPGVKYVYLTSVAAVDPRYAWAIGVGIHGSFIERWNGASWHQLPSLGSSLEP